MFRGIHIAVTFLTILALVKPLGCLAGTFNRKAAECCAKGKCLPTRDADECCKGTAPGGKQLSSPKNPDPTTALPVVLAAEAPIPMAPFAAAPSADAPAPPGSPPRSRLTLPLLI